MLRSPSTYTSILSVIPGFPSLKSPAESAGQNSTSRFLAWYILGAPSRRLSSLRSSGSSSYTSPQATKRTESGPLAWPVATASAISSADSSRTLATPRLLMKKVWLCRRPTPTYGDAGQRSCICDLAMLLP